MDGQEARQLGLRHLLILPRKVTMDQNYSLSEEEVAEGYVLGCQSHPASDNVIIDFDII